MHKQFVLLPLVAVMPEQWLLGVVYIRGRVGSRCGALLLRPAWSLVPGHCAAARAEPDLAALLPDWRVRYNVDGRDADTGLKRSIPHPHFNRNDFRNNIGVVQHTAAVGSGTYSYSFSTTFDPNKDANYNMKIVERTWNYTQDENGIRKREQNATLQILTIEDCSHVMSSIIELRSYEFCATVSDDSLCFDHGASVTAGSQVVGFFSWGPRCGDPQAPLTVTVIAPFQDWLQRITSI